MTLDDRWEEYRPAYYRLKEYTPEQIEILNRRPTELINAALKAATSTVPSPVSPDVEIIEPGAP